MKQINKSFLTVILLITFLFSSQSSISQQYILIAWNDLGMHCSNKDFSKIAVLPPYNNIYAQLILKMPNQLPQILKAGYKIEYSIPFNTYSVGKTNFWTYAQELFNLPQPLPPNIGLTGRGLTGLLDTGSNYFYAAGIPVTPFNDSDLVNERPFQTFHLIAKTVGGTVQLAFTDNVIPVSNEIGCVQSGCHTSEQEIKGEHPDVPGFKEFQPELCARCHASNALGTTGDSNAKPFSYRIHEKHHDIQPINGITTCYKCHPGPITQCFRDTMRAEGLICQNCHGTMSSLANSILNGRRPWLDEPKCGSATCHGSNFAEQPGKLYRESKGHGGLFCSACHGSPHAIYPSRELNDNLQSIRLQGHSGTIANCLVCHSSPPVNPGPHGKIYVGIKKLISGIPETFKLYQNYPNPFNPVTKIKFDIPENGFVSLKVYSISGSEVAVLLKEKLDAGSYETSFNASSLASGIYFYQITTQGFSSSKKMVLIK